MLLCLLTDSTYWQDDKSCVAFKTLWWFTFNKRDNHVKSHHGGNKYNQAEDCNTDDKRRQMTLMADVDD